MDMWVNSYGWLKELMVSQVFRLLEGGILCEKQKNRRCQMFSIYPKSYLSEDMIIISLANDCICD